MPQTKMFIGSFTVSTIGTYEPQRKALKALKGRLVTEKNAPPVLNDSVLWAFAESSRLSFWSMISRGCILSLSGFSFRLVFRYRWTDDMGAGCSLSDSFVASALVERCLSKVHFAVTIFTPRLKADFRPRPVQFLSVSLDRSRVNQHLIVAALIPGSLATRTWVITPLTISTAR